MRKSNQSSKKTLLTAVMVVGLLVILGVFMAGCGSDATETAAPVETTAPAAADTVTGTVPTAELEAVPAGEPMATSVKDTYIRTGPDVTYPAYAIAPAGKSAKVVGQSSDKLWYAVALPTEYVAVGYGWVNSADVTVENLPADLPVYPAGNVPPEVAFVPIESGEPQLTFNEATYVRTGPGEIYPAYGIAKVGMTARVIGKSDDGLWWQVKLPTELVGEGNGWVNGAYVTATNVSAVPVVPDPALPPVIQVTPLQEGDPYLIALTGVNVRTAPSTDAEVIGVAPVGYQFKVTGVTADGNWYRVELPADKVGTDTGWMSADYVYAYNVEGVEVVTP